MLERSGREEEKKIENLICNLVLQRKNLQRAFISALDGGGRWVVLVLVMDECQFLNEPNSQDFEGRTTPSF